VETKFDLVNNLVMNVDKTLTGGQGVGDIRSGEERAAFEVSYVLNPNVQVKPLVTDNSRDDIKEGEGYTFTPGENGKYQLVFTDDEGNEHTLETDGFPFTVKDGGGNTFEVVLNPVNSDVTVKEQVYTAENHQDSVMQNVDVGKMDERVKMLVDSLIGKIETYLSNSDNQFFRLAFENTEDLKENVIFDSTIGSGGEYKNGKMLIGINALVPGDKTDGSDGDVMATIFHEYMHYLGSKFNIYPKRYANEEKGIVYSEQVLLGIEMENDNIFKERAYKLFTIAKYQIDVAKYSNYPAFYDQLDGNQKAEVDKYIQDNNLSPQMSEVTYLYRPSNHAKDELNAHTKTLEASSLDLFEISFKKRNSYSKELIRYQEMYDICLRIEQKYNYTPDGVMRYK
jgi:hypothetical protein